MKVNFSIPVTLFDFRESDNSLYSYAKLKIFYIGETGDKRLFTKSFSDQLLESLPYVPVVGYYDDEKEDFLGHNPTIQHIYGIVPEDTVIEYVKEDNKEYAVCDVILYTGRVDKTGEIAQKIIGKQHSLELNPNNTTYVVNRDATGKMINIEFKTGTLLGLSILGDDEKPAFDGAEFFNEESMFIKMFNGFKEQLVSFTKKQENRGDRMNLETGINLEKDEALPLSFEEEGTGDNDPVNPEIPEEGDDNEVDEAISQNEDPDEGEDIGEGEDEDEGDSERKDRKKEEGDELDDQKEFLKKFIRISEEEKNDEIYSQFYKNFGDYSFIVQYSIEEEIIVYADLNDYSYHRVSFAYENGKVTGFGEPVGVKLRFLTEDEIDTLWPLAGNTAINMGTIAEASEGLDEEENTKEDSAKEIRAAALNESERAELEAFRREKKLDLIESFKEDLNSDVLEKIISKVDSYSYEELDTELSKEYTKAMKDKTNNKKPNTFIYTGPATRAATEAELTAQLVEKYKNKN